MTKKKAWFVAAIIMILAGGYIWSLWNFQIRSYYLVMQALGFYGFFMAGVNMAGWLAKDEARHEKKTYQDYARRPGE